MQLKLEAKENELEEVQMNSSKVRNDFLRRQDQLKREGDDKIAFLLQQLRQAENKLNTSQQLMDSTTVTNGASGRPMTGPLGHGTSGQQLRSSSSANSRPSTAVVTPNTPTPKLSRLSDEGLARQSLDAVQGLVDMYANANNNGNDGNDGNNGNGIANTDINSNRRPPEDSDRFLQQQQQQEEILRRWHSERERREQLEKKNSELFRELRVLRAMVKPKQ